MQDWAAGDFLHEASHAQTVSNARAIGNIETCRALLALEFSQLSEEEDSP